MKFTVKCASIYILVAIAFSNSFAQSHVIDSLRNVLKTEKDDSNKVKTLNKLSSKLRDLGKYDTAMIIASSSQVLAEKLDFKCGLAGAFSNFTIIYGLQGNYSKALEYSLKELAINEQAGDKRGIAANFGNIGIVYLHQGNYPEALDYEMKALKITEELGDKRMQAHNFDNIGNVYFRQGQYPSALEYHLKALKIAEELGDNNMKARNLGNIGLIYDDEGDYSKALEYYLKSLKMGEEMGDKTIQETNLVDVGNIYADLGDYSKALEYDFKALEMGEELGDKQNKANSFGNIGMVYCKKGDYTKALEYDTKALNVAEEIGETQSIAEKLNDIGSIYIKAGKFKEAEEYLKKAMDLDDSIGNKYTLLQDQYAISNLYDTTGRYKLALEYYKKAMVLKDTLFNLDKNKALTRKEMNYEFEKKEAAEKAEQDKKDAVDEQGKKRQEVIRDSFMAGFVLMIALVFFILKGNRQKQKANIIITQQKEEVENQKAIVDKKNKDITDSIHYASRIQRALLTTEEYIGEHLKEYFILFKPRDIVSGDFYWAFSSDDKNKQFHIACCDCTGHGVPGAFMSLLNISMLNETVIAKNITRPDLVLNDIRNNIIKALNPKGIDTESKDGMDCIFCSLDMENKMLYAACANNPLWIINKDSKTLKELTADKMPVGVQYGTQKPFTLHSTPIEKGDYVYMLTDGYVDQFGGPKGKKFMYKQLQELLLANNDKPMSEQKKILDETIDKWKGALEQVDDILIIGIRV